ncbi:hypothetical protein RB595_008385 [Gaeumannomyces hyphopodioides]
MASPTLAESLKFVTLDVFTSTRFAGNPLALVLLRPEDQSISQDAKQRIAREFNLSETAFLHLAPGDGAADQLRLDIFTPREELPFAGHPTVGAAAFLLLPAAVRDRATATLLTKAGPIPVCRGGGAGPSLVVRARIPHNVRVHAATARSAAVSTGLSADPTLRAAELDAPVVSIVKGMTFALVRLPDLAALGRAAAGPLFGGCGRGLLDREDGWDAGSAKRYYFVHLGTTTTSGGGGDGRPPAARTVRLRTRLLKEYEDPATGSAASALSCYLALSDSAVLCGDGAAEGRALGAEETVFFEVEQGVEMGRHSVIHVEVVRERKAGAHGWGIKEVYLGGTAVMVMEGTVRL